MKKILIALLAVLLCFSLVACKDPAETTENNGDDSTDTENIVDTDTLAIGEDDNTKFGPPVTQ